MLQKYGGFKCKVIQSLDAAIYNLYVAKFNSSANFTKFSVFPKLTYIVEQRFFNISSHVLLKSQECTIFNFNPSELNYPMSIMSITKNYV